MGDALASGPELVVSSVLGSCDDQFDRLGGNSLVHVDTQWAFWAVVP